MGFMLHYSPKHSFICHFRFLILVISLFFKFSIIKSFFPFMLLIPVRLSFNWVNSLSVWVTQSCMFESRVFIKMIKKKKTLHSLAKNNPFMIEIFGDRRGDLGETKAFVTKFATTMEVSLRSTCTTVYTCWS